VVFFLLESSHEYRKNETIEMKAKLPNKLRDGAQCRVIGGVHVGKSGIVTDINTSNTGYVTVTVVQPDGE
jgi:ribosomal protein S4E